MLVYNSKQEEKMHPQDFFSGRAVLRPCKGRQTFARICRGVKSIALPFNISPHDIKQLSYLLSVYVICYINNVLYIHAISICQDHVGWREKPKQGTYHCHN